MPSRQRRRPCRASIRSERGPGNSHLPLRRARAPSWVAATPTRWTRARGCGGCGSPASSSARPPPPHGPHGQWYHRAARRAPRLGGVSRTPLEPASTTPPQPRPRRHGRVTVTTHRSTSPPRRRECPKIKYASASRTPALVRVHLRHGEGRGTRSPRSHRRQEPLGADGRPAEPKPRLPLGEPREGSAADRRRDETTSGAQGPGEDAGQTSATKKE